MKTQIKTRRYEIQSFKISKEPKKHKFIDENCKAGTFI